MGLSLSSTWALPHLFSSLLLLAAMLVFAHAGEAADGLAKGQPANNPPAKTTKPTEYLNPKSKVPALGQHRNHPNIRFQQQGGLISLEARQTTWPQLLETTEQHTGACFHYASLPIYPVSLSLKGRSAQEVLTQLFGSATGYACRFSKSQHQSASGWPKEIWVMGIIASNSQSQALPPLPSIQTSVKDLTDEQLEEAVQLHYQRELDNLIDKVKNGTQDEKNQALVELSTRPEDEANKDEMNELLKAGLRNEDPDVRGQVIYGLASRGGAESYALLEEGLKDEALGVRVLAVNAINAGEDQGQKLLRQAISDSDATVRSVAQEKLKEAGLAVSH
jgi:HEAT repeats